MRRLHQVTAIMPEYFLSSQAIYLQKALSFRHRIFQISRCRCNNINHLRQKIGVYCRTWVHSYLNEIKAYCRRYFIPFFGRLNVRDIRAAHLEDFKAQLPPHLSSKTIYNIMGVLKKLFQDAYRRNDIPAPLRFPKVPLTEPTTKFLWPEEQEAILGQVQEPVYRIYYLFLMKQGCRPSEARALRWENIDLKNNLVTIASSFDRGHYRPFTKEREVRYLPLHPQVKEALVQLPRHLSGYVFVNRLGRVLSARRVDAVWKTAAAAAGIEATCYEGTRHSFASQAINRGVSQRKVGDFMGHRWEASTRRYAKMHAESLREVWGGEVCPQSVPEDKITKAKILKIQHKKR
jgi:integrase